MTTWVCDLTAVAASTGAITQLYHAAATAGSGATTLGTLKRTPTEGTLLRLEVSPDGTNGGTIEVWDLNGDDGGANVDTGTTITSAQKDVAIAAGKARLIYSQLFTGSSGARLAISGGTPFMRGLAARFSNSGPTGTCKLNLIVDGGVVKYPIVGA